MTLPPDPPVRAYIGLGSNLGDSQAILYEAIFALDELPQTSVRAQSSLYRTPAWGRTDQPDFINAVVELQTRLVPEVLLQQLLAMERRFGRVRRDDERWGPRELDLDLLMHGETELDAPGLHLPHPRIRERAFVLVPLAEIAPGLEVPGMGRVADLLAAVASDGIDALP